MEKTFAETLEAGLLAKGAALVGYADLRGVPAASLPYGISIAVAVPPGVVREIETGPTARYFAAYKTLNTGLARLAEWTVAQLQNEGCTAMALAASVKADAEKVGKAPLPHKTVATQAGLGWVGKSALLVTPQYGGAVRIISVLTDIPLPTATPITAQRCGECSLCVQHCPGHALTGAAWQPDTEREELFNAEACRDAARALSRKNFGANATMCGKCFVVCPHTRQYLRRENA